MLKLVYSHISILSDRFLAVAVLILPRLTFTPSAVPTRGGVRGDQPHSCPSLEARLFLPPPRAYRAGCPLPAVRFIAPGTARPPAARVSGEGRCRSPAGGCLGEGPAGTSRLADGTRTGSCLQSQVGCSGPASPTERAAWPCCQNGPFRLGSHH